jgi:hypothetical protein
MLARATRDRRLCRGKPGFEYVDVRAIRDGKRYWNGTRWMG